MSRYSEGESGDGDARFESEEERGLEEREEEEDREWRDIGVGKEGEN